MTIPKIFHFVYFGFTNFTFIHYLSVATCYVVHRPKTIYLYVHHLPEDIECEQAKWFRLIKPFVTLERVELPTQIFGRPVKKFQHMADVIRLEKLIERGGVYLDLDVVSLRPFGKLYQEKCVMGIQCPMTKYEGLCNAVIMSEPKGEFITRWYQEYTTFQSSRWDHHSVKIPHLLSKLFSNLLKVVDCKHFFPVSWEEPNFMVNRELDHKLQDSNVVHLWESEWEKSVLKPQDYSILRKNSTFSYLVNPIINKFQRIVGKKISITSSKQNKSQLLIKSETKVITPTLTVNIDNNMKSHETTLSPTNDITFKPLSWMDIINSLDQEVDHVPTKNKTDNIKPDINVNGKNNTNINIELTIRKIKKIITGWKLPIINSNSYYDNTFKVHANRNLNYLLSNQNIDHKLYYHNKSSIILDFLKTCDTTLNITLHYLLNTNTRTNNYFLVADNNVIKYLTKRNDLTLDRDTRHIGYGNLLLGDKIKIAIIVMRHMSRNILTYYLPNSQKERYISLSSIKTNFINLDWKVMTNNILVNISPKSSTLNDLIYFLNIHFSYIRIIDVTAIISNWKFDNNKLINIAFIQHDDKYNHLSKQVFPDNVKLWSINYTMLPQLLIIKNDKNYMFVPYEKIYPLVKQTNNPGIIYHISK